MPTPRRYLVSILALLLIASASGATAESAEWTGRKAVWKGFDQYHFKVDGRDCYVVVPKKELPGRPWIWRARFPGYHAEMDVKLVGRGFHIAYMNVAGMFGSPTAIGHGNAFYRHLTEKHKFAAKPALEGVSRGGLFVYNWAAKNPDKVACIYADTPVLDFKSWPAGKGKGKFHGPTWQGCLKAYGLTEAEALKYKYNPVDNYAPIAKAKIPILHVVSENDRIVPPAENTYILKPRYEKLGGSFEVISVPKGTAKSSGHHFTHPEQDRVVEFIAKHAAVKESVDAAK